MPPVVDRNENPWSRRLTSAAFVLLLCCAAGRCFVQELQFRLSPLRLVLSPIAVAGAGRAPIVSAEEVARVTYAIGLLAAGALAAVGAAVSGRLVVRRAWLAGLILLFAAAGFVSAMLAPDRKSGLVVWLEQAALVSACLAAAQLCGDRRRWRVVLSVLLALGIAMAATGLWQHFAGAGDREEFLKLRAGSQPAAGSDSGSRMAEMLEQRLREDTPTGYLGLPNTFASLLILLLSVAAGVAADAVAHARAGGRGRGEGVPPLRPEGILPSASSSPSSSPSSSSPSSATATGGKRGLPKGEIPAAPVAAGAAIAVCLAILLTLALTRSRAGIACAALAVVAGAGIGVFRRRLARHWKKAVAAALAGAVLLGAGVMAYGLKKDALPGKSMTFRWFYWTASAQIIREHPLWGVGGGNFPDAYLRVRRAEAEEEVRDPHNVIMHALAQFGLAGGLPYLAMIVGVLVCLARSVARASRPCVPGASRPRSSSVATSSSSASASTEKKKQHTGGTAVPGAMPLPVCGEGHVPAPHAHPSPRDKLHTADEHGTPQTTFWVGAVITLAVFLSRAFFGDLGTDAGVLLVEAVWPAAVFAVALFLATSLVGMSEAARAEGGWTSLALAVGAAAFVLHNLTEFGLWTPGVALIFWLSAGACLAQCPGGGQRGVMPQSWVPRLRFPAAVREESAPEHGCKQRSRGTRDGSAPVTEASQRDLSCLRWPLAAGAIAAVVAAGVFVWRPTLLKTLDAQQAADLWHEGRLAAAAGAAARAAQADPLDDLAASDAARMIVGSTPPDPPAALGPALAKAERWIAQAVQRNPASCANWQLWATIAWHQAVPDSFRYARRAMGKDPNVAEKELLGMLKDGRPVSAELGHLEYARGRFAQAASYFTQALERDPNSSFLRGCLGDSLWRDGRREEALAAWREAAARFPAGPAVNEALGRMREAVARNPADAHFHLGYARMLCEAGQFQKCLAEIAKAREIDGRLIDFARKYPPPSKTIFSAEGRAQAEMLQARAEAGRR